MNKFFIIGVCCILPIVIIAVIWVASNRSGNQSPTTPSENLDLQGEEIPILGRDHVLEGTKISHYNSDPPTSGPHWPQPAEWGIYLSPLPDEQLVHNLEHGGIWISYKDLDNDAITALGTLAKQYPQAVVITPRAQNESKIAVASWGRLDTFDVLNMDRIETFIKSNINNAPEPLASLEQMLINALSVGASFPDFQVTEVDGRTITRDSLSGKPAIIWFTTSWCVPCQIGAKEVARIDNELGGKAFEVLVIFVDLRETDADLVNWRKQFANSDWMVAFDNELTNLAKRINLKFLDSKFLLDNNGVIQNIDFKIADESYLNIIRQVVGRINERHFDFQNLAT